MIKTFVYTPVQPEKLINKYFDDCNLKVLKDICCEKFHKGLDKPFVKIREVDCNTILPKDCVSDTVDPYFKEVLDDIQAPLYNATHEEFRNKTMKFEIEKTILKPVVRKLRYPNNLDNSEANQLDNIEQLTANILYGPSTTAPEQVLTAKTIEDLTKEFNYIPPKEHDIVKNLEKNLKRNIPL
jgi:hypothetical protein